MHMIKTASFFNQVNFVLIAAFGCWLVFQDLLSIGGLAACIILANRTLQPICKATTLLYKLQMVDTATDNFKAIQALESQSNEKKSLPKIKHIELQHADYQVSSTEIILQDVSFEAHQGEIILIEGQRTHALHQFVQMLSGHCSITKGQFLVNQSTLTPKELTAYQQHISYFDLNNHLFQGTIQDNITMFQPQSHSQLLHLSSALNLHPFVQKLPHGYATQIGQGQNDVISKGIQQKIILARSLFLSRDIYILVEPTFALDNASTDSLCAYLTSHHKDAITIVVSHTKALFDISDHIYKLDRQTLIRTEGTHFG